MISFSLFNVRAVWTAALLLPLTTAWVAAAERTPEQAFQEYLSEAQMGNVESMSNLGLAYLVGVGTNKDVATGLKWLHQAADAGSKDALMSLADAYFGGTPKPDHAEALIWYRKAAAGGNSEAYRIIAGYYQRGDGVKKDPAEMVKAYRQAIAADDHLSLLELGKLYAEGQEVSKDLGEAGRLMSKAAFVGVPFAPEAYQALKAANPDLTEKVATTSEPATRALYTRAKAGDAAAMYAISEKFGAGEGGLSKDDDESSIWLEKSAQGGYATAQTEYSKTLGYRGQPKESLAWAQKAAAQKDHEGEFLVGQHYEGGKGVEKNPTEAIKWYRLAAEAGHATAMRSLGMLLAQAKDYAGARTWLEKAKATGDTVSADMLASLASVAPASASGSAPAANVAAASANSTSATAVIPPELRRARHLFEVAYEGAGSDHERLMAWKWFLADVAAAINAGKFSKRIGTEFALKPLLPHLESNSGSAYPFVAEINQYTFDLAVFRELASQPVRDSVKRDADAELKNLDASLDFIRSQKALFDRAKAGDPAAEYQVGALYANNELIHDQNSALDWIKKAAAHGYKDAQTLLKSMSAEAYNYGGAALKDGKPVLAIAKYRYAVFLGDEGGTFAIGYIQARGYEDVPPDPAAAMKSFRQAAEAGVTPAMLTIGEAYLKGDGVPVDHAEAIRWIRRAASANDPEAQVRLANCYLWGRGGLEKSVTEAAEWYRKAASNDFGATQMVLLLDNCKTDAERQAMALAYACNAITDEHLVEACLAWLEDAEQFGFAPAGEWVDAQDKLDPAVPAGDTHELANKAYQAKNDEEAIRLWRKAADAGNRWSMIAIGSLYAHGRAGLKEDHKEARTWYEKAAAGGAIAGRIALWDMDSGQFVDDGVAAYLAKRYDEARAKFEKAITMGNRLGYFNLGLMNENGNGAPMDLPRALTLYTQAFALESSQGSEAMERVKKRLIKRDILEQGMKLIDAKEFVVAKATLQVPADAGNPEAMTNLAYAYENMPAGMADDAKAEELYNKAIALKYPPASEMLRRLKAKQAAKAGK